MSKLEKLKKVGTDIWLLFTIVGFILVMIDIFLSPTSLIFKWTANVICGIIAVVFVIQIGLLVGKSIKNVYRNFRN